MIQAIKEAVLAGLQSLAVPGGLCDGLTAFSDSEVDTQPTANSPMFQIKFLSEVPPTELQGIGAGATHFETAITYLAQIKTTAPQPQAARDLYNLWYRRDTVTGNLTGVKIAINQLLATGLVLSTNDRFRVDASEMRRGLPHPPYTDVLEIRLTFTNGFNG